MGSSFYSPLLLTIFSVALLCNFSAGEPVVGGWEPIKDPNSDPKVVEIAAFAVHEHNKEANERLVFKKVISGESVLVGGTDYKLVIAVTTGGDVDSSPPSKYEAVIYDPYPWIHPKERLISFKRFN